MKNENKTPEYELVLFLQGEKENIFDVFYTAYVRFLKQSQCPQNLLRVIFELSGDIGSGETASEKVPEAVQNEIEQQLPEVKKIVTDLAKENKDTDAFYSALWEKFFISSPFAQSDEQCAVLLKLLSEDVLLLPYYHAIDLCTLEKEEFKALIEKMKPRIIESTHMLNRHFAQKTETTSQLCRIARDLPPVDTCVYWAAILSMIERSSYKAGYTRAMSTIQKTIDRDTAGE